MHHLHALAKFVEKPTPVHLLVLVALAVLGVATVYLVSRYSPTVLLSLTVAAEAFSGNWKYMKVPLPLDRLIFAAGIASLVLGGAAMWSERKLRLQAVHFCLLGLAAYGLCSAIYGGTITTSLGFFALLDRFGWIPFLMFTLAPLLFGTERQRNVLLVIMVAFGFYISLTAVFEGLRLTKLVFPHYITNTSLGITTGRARGPFLNGEADGMGMFFCAACSAIALTRWKSALARWLCVAVICLSSAGIFFTLTRAVWIGAVFGVVCASLLDARVRKIALRAAALVLVGVAAALAVPHIRHRVIDRVTTQSSIWDRLNTFAAAGRLIRDHPIFGIGWERFVTVGPSAMRQSPNYPLTGIGLEIHNVFLSHVTELGIVGGGLWILAFCWVSFNAGIRPCSAELYPWRVAFLAFFGMFLAVAMAAPLADPQANLIFWMMGGLVAMERYSVPRDVPELLARPGRLGDGGSWSAPSLDLPQTAPVR